jgi:hypothetical protein
MTTISIMSGAVDLSASPVAQAVSEYTFQSYRIGVIVIGLALVALAWAGLGASTVARIICVVVGALFVGNGLYLFLFADRHTLWELYPFAFILPFLVVGYFLYTRVLERELDSSVRSQVEAERAAERARLEAELAARAAEQSNPETPGQSDADR